MRSGLTGPSIFRWRWDTRWFKPVLGVLSLFTREQKNQECFVVAKTYEWRKFKVSMNPNHFFSHNLWHCFPITNLLWKEKVGSRTFGLFLSEVRKKSETIWRLLKLLWQRFLTSRVSWYLKCLYSTFSGNWCNSFKEKKEVKFYEPPQ